MERVALFSTFKWQFTHFAWCVFFFYYSPISFALSHFLHSFFGRRLFFFFVLFLKSSRLWAACHFCRICSLFAVFFLFHLALSLSHSAIVFFLIRFLVLICSVHNFIVDSICCCCFSLLLLLFFFHDLSRIYLAPRFFSSLSLCLSSWLLSFFTWLRFPSSQLYRNNKWQWQWQYHHYRIFFFGDKKTLASVLFSHFVNV